MLLQPTLLINEQENVLGMNIVMQTMVDDIEYLCSESLAQVCGVSYGLFSFHKFILYIWLREQGVVW